ncbi:hypothetical protein DXG01_014856, partial [Tephrocybe rancida]
MVMDGGVALVPPGKSDSSTLAATHIPVIPTDDMDTSDGAALGPPEEGLSTTQVIIAVNKPVEQVDAASGPPEESLSMVMPVNLAPLRRDTPLSMARPDLAIEQHEVQARKRKRVDKELQAKVSHQSRLNELFTHRKQVYEPTAPQVTAYKTELRRLREENDILKNNNSSLKADNLSLTHDKDTLTHENDKLTQDRNKQDISLSKLQGEVATLREEIELNPLSKLLEERGISGDSFTAQFHK